MTIEPVSVVIATELRGEIEKLIQNDPKMKGIARYLNNVTIFWSYNIPTACAGHGFIFFNPDFWARIPEQTRITVMAHEVWHLILKHLERGEFCDPEDHNKAGDHVINNILDNEGFTFDGTDPLKDPKYKNMSTEEVYNIIHTEKKKQQQQNPEAKGEKSNHVPKSVIDTLVKAAADLIAGDDNYNNMPNQINGNDKVLEDLKNSLGGQTGHKHIKLEITNSKPAIKNVTYEQIFKDYLIDPIFGGKRSFMRPNRRQHNSKDLFKLPGRVKRKVKSNRLAHLIYALDVSGSIDTATAQTFHNSVRTIKELLNPNLLTVLFFDTEIKLTKVFKDTEPYTQIEVKAGGCTCLDAVYTYAANKDADAMVIFTDLAVTIPKKPKWHTIWLLPERHRKANVIDLYGDLYIIPTEY